MNIYVIPGVFASVGLLIIVYYKLKWKKLYAGAYVDDIIVSARQRYRNFTIFGFILTFAAIGTYIDSSIAFMVIIGTLLSNSRVFFEPYFNASIANNLRDFCLYLRPFGTDSKLKGGSTKGFMWLPEPIEKSLFELLNMKVAQSFAIGNPNECLPTTLSTTNIYANDSEWKDTVAKLCQNAKIIIFRVGDTEGCMWEIAHCVSNNYLNKTIFLIENNDMLDLIKKKHGAIFSNVFLNAIENNFAYALFWDNENGKWKTLQIKSKKNIHIIINSYIITHPHLRNFLIAQEKECGIFNVRSSKKDSPAIFWQSVSIMTNFLAYALFNEWPKRWWCAFIIYEIISFVTAFYIVDVDSEVGIYVIVVVFCMLSLPWLWLAPRISWRCRNWGSREVFAKTNRILALWLLLLSLCIIIICLFSLFEV